MDEDFETTTELIKEARENDTTTSNVLPTKFVDAVSTSSVNISSTAPATSSASTWNQAVVSLAQTAQNKLESAKDAADKAHESSKVAIERAQDKAKDVTDSYSSSNTGSSKGIMETAREELEGMMYHGTTTSTTPTTTPSSSSIMDKARDVLASHDTTPSSKGILDKVRDTAQNLFGQHATTTDDRTTPATGPLSDIDNVLDPRYPKDTTTGVIQQASRVDRDFMSSPWDEAVMRPSADIAASKPSTAYQYPTSTHPTALENTSDKAAIAAAKAQGTLEKWKHEAADVAHDVNLNTQLAGMAIKSKVEDAQHQVSHQVDSLKHAVNDKFHK